ncbi:hypothetical protein J1N35_025413, partial [Gossypium stocksii]
CVSIQEAEASTILPTSGSGNPEIGIEALTQVVREGLEKVFEAILRRNRELVQS